MILGVTFNLRLFFSKITNNNHEKIIISGHLGIHTLYLDTFSQVQT